MRKALFLLASMSEADVEWVARNGEKRRLPAGTVLIQEGQPTHSLFFLLRGKLSVSTQAAGVVAELETGEVVGEISFVDSRPPTASVVAASECEVGAVTRSMLSAKLKQDVSFAAHFYQALAMFLADRLRQTTQLVGGRKAQFSEDIEDVDEMAGHLLDTVSLAGQRFAELQRRAWGPNG